MSRGFVDCPHAAEGDATALEAKSLGRFRDWFVMLATTRMTKSFKMVLLWVLIDNDAVFSGMPIPELAGIRTSKERVMYPRGRAGSGIR